LVFEYRADDQAVVGIVVHDSNLVHLLNNITLFPSIAAGVAPR
jgi:hypothetical protein